MTVEAKGDLGTKAEAGRVAYDLFSPEKKPMCWMEQNQQQMLEIAKQGIKVKALWEHHLAWP